MGMGGIVDAKKLHQSVTVFRLAAVEAGKEDVVEVLQKILDKILANPYRAGVELEDADMVQKWNALSE